MHWHGRPRDHPAPRYFQLFACGELDALRRLQKLFLDAVMIFLPAMIGERGDIVENEAVLLRIKLRRRFRVSSAPCGAITVGELAKHGVIAGLLLRAGTNERQHRARQRRGYVQQPAPTLATIGDSIARRCSHPGAPSNPGQEFAGDVPTRAAYPIPIGAILQALLFMVEMPLDSRQCLHYELLFTRAVPFRGGFMSLLLRRPQPAALIVPLVLCFSFGFSAQALNAQTVKLHASSKAGDRLTPKVDLQFSDAKPIVGATF